MSSRPSRPSVDSRDRRYDYGETPEETRQRLFRRSMSNGGCRIRQPDTHDTQRGPAQTQAPTYNTQTSNMNPISEQEELHYYNTGATQRLSTNFEQARKQMRDLKEARYRASGETQPLSTNPAERDAELLQWEERCYYNSGATTHLDENPDTALFQMNERRRELARAERAMWDR
jgi:hypothetical protein